MKRKMKMKLEDSKTQSSSILSNRSTGKSQSENIKYDLRQKNNLLIFVYIRSEKKHLNLKSFLTRKDEKASY